MQNNEDGGQENECHSNSDRLQQKTSGIVSMVSGYSSCNDKEIAGSRGFTEQCHKALPLNLTFSNPSVSLPSSVHCGSKTAPFLWISLWIYLWIYVPRRKSTHPRNWETRTIAAAALVKQEKTRGTSAGPRPQTNHDSAAHRSRYEAHNPHETPTHEQLPKNTCT